MSVPDTEPGYPPPSPPKREESRHWYRYESVPERISEAPTSSFEELVEYLTKETTGDVAKMKSVLMWMAHQNYSRVPEKSRASQDTPAGFLKLVAQKKEDLASLFAVLCRKAGVPCVVIHGCCKDLSPWDATAQKSPVVNSKWTTVYVNDQWGLVHPALMLKGVRLKKSPFVMIECNSEAVRHSKVSVEHGTIDTEFFLMKPDHFIFVCRPEKEECQLLEQPWTWDEFRQSPNRRPRSQYSSSPAKTSSPEASSIEQLTVEDSLSTYPQPSPPKSRKKDVWKEQMSADIDKRAKQVPAKLYSSYKDLLDHLLEGLKTEVEKVRALLVWMSENCDYCYSNMTRETYKKTTDPRTPAGAIKIRAYRYFDDLPKERFLAELCRQADVPCVVIRGQKKRADLYKLGTDTTTKEMMWNAVYADGNWRLINTHDAIRHLDYKEWVETDINGTQQERNSTNWSRKFNEFFFLTDPDEMIHFCFPNDERWQLLDKPLTRDQFFSEPWIHPAYFQAPIRLGERSTVLVKARNGIGTVHFQGKFSDKLPLPYKLYYIEKEGQSFPEELQLASYITMTRILNRKPPPGNVFHKMSGTNGDNETYYIKDSPEDDQQGQDPEAAEDKESQTTRARGTQRTRAVFFTLRVKGTYILEMINDSGDTLCKILIDCFGDTSNNQSFWGSGSIGYGVNETAQKAGLEEALRGEGMVVARPGDRITFKFKFKQSKPKTDRDLAEPVAGEKQSLRSRFKVELSQQGRNPKSTAKLVKVKEEGDEICLEAKVPFGPKSSQTALRINVYDGNVVTNIVNYKITSDTALVAAASDRTVVEQVQTELVVATEDDDVDRLEVAVRESRSARVNKDKVHGGEQVSAQQRLMDLHKEAISKAIDSGNAQTLEAAMMSAHKSQISFYVHRQSWFEAAEKKLREFKRQGSTKQKGTRLSQREVDSVTRYIRRPHHLLATVMGATLTLLGHSDLQLKDWKGMRSLLRSRGDESVVQRVHQLDVKKVKDTEVDAATRLLSGCTLQTVTKACTAAVPFFKWTTSVLAQIRDLRNKQQAEETDGEEDETEETADGTEE